MQRLAVSLFVAVAACAGGAAPGPASHNTAPRTPVITGSGTSELFDRYLVAYHSNDAAKLAALYSDDALFEDITLGQRMDGRPTFESSFRQIFALHTEPARLHVMRKVIDASSVVAEVTWSGQIDGAVLGTPDTPRDYAYTGVVLLEIRDRRIVRETHYIDVDAFRRLFPSTSPPGASLRGGSLPPIADLGDSPGGTVVDANGTKTPLVDRTARRPRLIVFYRGHWCVFCRKQLAEIERARDKWQPLGLDVVAVSAEREDIARMRRYSGATFPLYADPRRDVIDAWGVLDREQDIARPAVFILDRAGHIRYRYVGETEDDRPSFETLVAFVSANRIQLGTDGPGKGND